MKKMKKTGYIALLAVSFLTGHYGLPFVRQPAELIYVNDRTVVVKTCRTAGNSWSALIRFINSRASRNKKGVVV